MELTDHVYAFPLTYDLGDREMTIYPSGVETEDGLILLDAGLPGKIDTLADALAEDGFSLDDVDTLFLTHQDGDHVGGAAELLDRTHASVVASTGDTPAIEGDEELVKSDRYPPINVDIEVVDGVTFRTEAGPMRVVETPGHTPGHLSVVLPEAELLIAADATVADEDGLQGPNETFTPEMEMAIRSLGKLAAFDTSGTLCYHGGFVEDADVEATYQSLTK
ncbi:MBL fold metallo-hydrolase [Haladaptatus sp. R4]|uniref:MBL fold metallo-hydrolase n=1 Tax=Haladaptatus sp. R4 TaxID=1679489 RepID=UPI0007B49D73|nr:MBL fold metallo-hydrolase [Haladaptatus sp. R4]KZN24052.1 MBL fold metallo-hydrolase [Haladaptatus sp. R4]